MQLREMYNRVRYDFLVWPCNISTDLARFSLVRSRDARPYWAGMMNVKSGAPWPRNRSESRPPMATAFGPVVYDTWRAVTRHHV